MHLCLFMSVYVYLSVWKGSLNVSFSSFISIMLFIWQGNKTVFCAHWQNLNPTARPASQLTRAASQTAAAGPVAENKYINRK